METAALHAQKGLNRDRNVFFVNQRGVYHADPRLSCPEIDQFLVETTGLSVLTPSIGDKDSGVTELAHNLNSHPVGKKGGAPSTAES